MHRIIAGTIVATALTLGLNPSAHAGPPTVLVAGPLEPDGTTDFDCLIVNVSDEAVTVKSEMMDAGSAITERTRILGPGIETSLYRAASLIGGPAYCRFTISGKASTVRAAGGVFQPGTGHISAVPAH